jgi:hypothetical protein
MYIYGIGSAATRLWVAYDVEHAPSVARHSDDVTDLTVQALSDAMNGFWRAYDSEQGSARRCTEYRTTMEGYRNTAHTIFDTYTALHVAVDAAPERDRREHRPHMQTGHGIWHTESYKEQIDKVAAVYRREFAVLLKSMVPYLQQRTAEAFAHAKKDTLPGVHQPIHSLRAARANPFVLR